MAMISRSDSAAAAWMSAMALFAATQPGGVHRPGAGGTHDLATGVPIPMLNGVVAIDREIDVDEVARLAAGHSGRPTPWSIQVRGDHPDQRIARIASAHGLDQRFPLPFMIKRLGTQDGKDPQTALLRVQRLGSADGDRYQELLAAGYGGPLAIFAAFRVAALMDHPQVSTYLIEDDGVPVATSVGVLVDDQVAVFNIAVPPEHRRRGHGRTATAAVLRDAYAAGARTALLHASPLGLPLYLAMGFEVAENWSVFSS